MGELRKLRFGNAENVVTPYTAGDDTVIIDETTRQIKVNPEEIATQDDLDDIKSNLSQLQTVLSDESKRLLIDILKNAFTGANEDENIDALNEIFFPTTSVPLLYYLGPVPSETTYEFDKDYSGWNKGQLIAENETVMGGTLEFTFDDAVATMFDFRMYLLNSDGTPYKHVGWSQHNVSGIQGEWVFDNWQNPGSGASFGKVAKSFTTVIEEGKIVIVCLRLGTGATIDESVIGGSDSTAFCKWAYDGGITMQISGGTEVG